MYSGRKTETVLLGFLSTYLNDLIAKLANPNHHRVGGELQDRAENVFLNDTLCRKNISTKYNINIKKTHL